MKHDATFTAESLFGSEQWCAATLGRSTDWLTKNIGRLESEGFPKKDPIIGLRNKADVLEWVAKRRKFADTQGIARFTRPADMHHDTTKHPGENLENL